MYRNFFSLSDLPFSISPDPRYLFMSDRHKEALSHLTYGLGEVGGFALLTGEVGTGKTTISRCLMEQLPDNTQAAFILNPTLSSQELLATLCDELQINYEKSDESLKHLTDKISEKLLLNHENDINTLLIIDEAQHLQPEVLEQLRLLTNLETNTKKLLQVILIGQPELQQLLQRRDLRQLAQRITARYHLMPLTKVELKQYIEHRLTIADCVRPIFDKGAIDKIHQLSQGVPRIINLLCHSALIQAYNQNDSVVSKKIVMTAAERALGVDLTAKQGAVQFNQKLMISTAVSVAAFIGIVGFWWGQQQESVTATIESQPTEIVSITAAKLSDDVESSDATTDRTKSAPIELTDSEPLVVDYEPPKFTLQEPQLIKQEHLAPDGLYTVQSGDTLFRISVQFNVKISSLRQWNNIPESNEIRIGDQVYVVEPSYASNGNTQNSQRTPTKNNIANNNQREKMRFVSGERPKQGTDIKYQVKPVAGVSNDLLALFQEAIDETEPEKVTGNDQRGNFSNIHDQPKKTMSNINTSRVTTESTADDNGTNILPLSQMPQSIQEALPRLKFEQHIYTSDKKGWVTESGSNYYEGDFITDRLKLDKILPQEVILSFDGQTFSMPALTNW